MYRKKVTFSQQQKESKTEEPMFMPKANYQNIIQSRPVDQAKKPSDYQEKKPSDKNVQNLSYSLSDIDEDELKREMMDGVDSDLEEKASLNEFDRMTNEEKLQTLAQRAQGVYKKANEFEEKLLKLNKQYNFLDSAIEKELGNFKQRHPHFK